MKGALHTDEVMGAVVNPDTGLRTERRISHIFVLDVPTYPKLLLDHRRRHQYLSGPRGQARHRAERDRSRARDRARSGRRSRSSPPSKPSTPQIKSTVEAAALCKMADRGQITGGILDGPLAFDNAISKAAAKTKHIVSPVAGDADILVVPDMEAGNMLAKQLTYLAGADAAGIVLGARVPIMLTSRADGSLARTGVLRAGAALRAPANRARALTAAILVAQRGLLEHQIRASTTRPATTTARSTAAASTASAMPRACARTTRRAPRCADVSIGGAVSHDDCLAALLQWIASHSGGIDIVCAGHRVVHGGRDFAGPVKITDAVMRKLDALCPLAPQHQPHNLAAIRALARLHPALTQIACFDTAFHVTQPAVATAFALPRALTESGVKRYGFHGLSYDYIASILPQHLGGKADGRIVVAHLGHGASMCAMFQRRSVATTMGFSALDGLMMGSRCGALDPGVILYMLDALKMSSEDIGHLLYNKSGLLGVSGVSDDMRDLLASRDPHAAEAVDLFVYRIVRELGSLAAALGGLDALVFTAGIGEHSAEIRSRVCAQAAWLGLALDETANRKGGPDIGKRDAGVAILALPTDEESVIAKACRAML